MINEMEYKDVLGLLSGAMAVLAYWIYLRDVFANKTKPHAFSWLIWGLLATTAYFGQVSGKAGAGVWVTGLTAAGCLLIFVVAIFKGEKNIRPIDKLLLALASLSIVLLVAVKDARISTTLAIVALVIGSFLTTKKAYYKPNEETAKTFALNSVKFIPSIFALSTYSYLTVAYPASALITNAIIFIVIVWRRNRNMNVVFLDRDGTVIVDPTDERVDGADEIELFPDSIEALKYLADHDFAVVFITNQSGIAEGRLAEDEFWQIHNKVLEKLAPSGIKILKTYMNSEAASPDATDWRKPGPNMLLSAAEELDLNIKGIYMVGDRQSDVQAGINAGCKGGILVQTATNKVVESSSAVYTAPHLIDAVRYIVESS